MKVEKKIRGSLLSLAKLFRNLVGHISRQMYRLPGLGELEKGVGGWGGGIVRRVEGGAFRVSG